MSLRILQWSIAYTPLIMVTDSKLMAEMVADPDSTVLQQPVPADGELTDCEANDGAADRVHLRFANRWYF